MQLDPKCTAVISERYEIVRQIGVGGMATVYLVRDVKHDRDVALEVLRAELSQSLGRERFFREIKLAARLTHPHILPLHDSGEVEGLLYCVMPGSHCPRVADALDYAHRHDVVHRDIEPENILLHEGHAVVADFGIGKAIVAAANASGILTLSDIYAGATGRSDSSEHPPLTHRPTLAGRRPPPGDGQADRTPQAGQPTARAERDRGDRPGFARWRRHPATAGLTRRLRA